MKAIHKDKLKGHYVLYMDSDTKCRTEKVIKVVGRMLTLVNCLGRKRRINLDFVKGCIHNKNKLRDIEG